MQTWKNTFFVAGTLGILALAGSFMSRDAAAQGGPSVHIAGPLPLPVTTGATEPVSFATSCISSTDSQCVAVSSYSVPAGKRLVIEYISMQCLSLPAGEAADIRVNIANSTATSFFDIYVGPNPIVVNNRSTMGQLVKIYADPGSAVKLIAQRVGGAFGNATPASSYFMQFTGHLEPAS